MSSQTRIRELSRAPITLDDLTADLVWPRLLRAASLALHPSRLGIAFFLVVALMLIGELVDGITGLRGSGVEEGTGEEVMPLGAMWGMSIAGIIDGIVRLEPRILGGALYRAFVVTPALSLANFPVGTIVAVVLGVPAFAIAGGAISRMAACESALGMSVSWPQGLGFAVGRLGTIIAALVGPLAVVWVLALLVALGGVLLRVPVLDVVGAVLFVVALVLGVVAVLVMIAYLVGQPMLIPAVACDGADSIDAIQRAYAYVFGRPLRLAAYLAVLLLQAVVLYLIVQAIRWGVMTFAAQSAAAGGGERGLTIFQAARGASQVETAEEVGAMGLAAAWVIRLWLAAVAALVWGYALSFYFCGSTLLYMAMRRVTDGQDMHEVWLPGMVEGTSAAESAEEGGGDGKQAPPSPGLEGGFVE